VELAEISNKSTLVPTCEVEVSFDPEDVFLYSQEYHSRVFLPRYRSSRREQTKYVAKLVGSSVGITLFTIASVYIVGTLTEALHWTLLALLAAPFLALTSLWFFGRCLPDHRNKRSFIQVRYRLHIDSDGLTLRWDDWESKFFWRAVDDLVVTEHYFIFSVLSPSPQCYPAPHHCFESREAAGEFLKSATHFWKAAHRVDDQTAVES